MKSKKSFKLSLNKTTVAHLDNVEMSNMRGGVVTGSVCKSVAISWCTCPGISQCMLPSKDNWTCSCGTDLASVCLCDLP